MAAAENNGNEDKIPLKATFLHDKGSGEDLLSNNIICDALCATVQEINPPVTIGILGKFGTGKSFLLSQILQTLKKENNRISKRESPSEICSLLQCCFSIIFASFLLAIFTLPVAMLVAPNVFVMHGSTINSTGNETYTPLFAPPDATTVSICGAVLLAVLIVLLFAGICLQNFLLSWWKNLRINCMVGFSKQPTEERFIEGKKFVTDCRYILVDFDAWEYIGCDRLWAGIITKLAQEIEKEFGIVTTRLFRAQYDEIVKCHDNETPKCFNKDPHSCCLQICNYPKTKCFSPTFCCWIVAPIFLIILFAVGVIFAISLSNSVTYTALKATFIAIPLVAATVATVKAGWTMFNSQSQRILDKLKGVKANIADELGFMHNVKVEVQCITDLIEWAIFSKKLNYKVIICIDNLDRLPLEKVKAVLEAVHVLLSDESSPFICLLAVDQRTAVNSVEENGVGLGSRRINGHEYLKKIITLPVYYPEVSSGIALRYLDNLVADAYRFPSRKKDTEQKADVGNAEEEDEGIDYQAMDGSLTIPEYMRVNCFRFIKMYKDFNTGSLVGNLRNIKRIVNIEILSTHILNMSTKQSSERGKVQELQEDDKKLVEALGELALEYPGRTQRLCLFLNDKEDENLTDALPTIYKDNMDDIAAIQVTIGSMPINNNNRDRVNGEYLTSLKKSPFDKKTGADTKDLLAAFEDYSVHRYMLVCVALADQWPCLFCLLLQNICEKFRKCKYNYNDKTNYKQTIQKEVEEIKKNPITLKKASELDEKPSLLWETIEKLDLNLNDFYVLNVILMNVDKTVLCRLPTPSNEEDD